MGLFEEMIAKTVKAESWGFLILPASCNNPEYIYMELSDVIPSMSFIITETFPFDSYYFSDIKRKASFMELYQFSPNKQLY